MIQNHTQYSAPLVLTLPVLCFAVASAGAEPEQYLDLVPWEGLAGANHNFLLTERRRNYLRYSGGLSFFEINGPAGVKGYGTCWDTWPIGNRINC
jgi:hypothetical protein